MGSRVTEMSPNLDSKETTPEAATTSNLDALSPLDQYRMATGIASHEEHAIGSSRSAANVGIYMRTVEHETKAKQQHQAVSSVIFTCLALEIVFAATLTAMGAAKVNFIAITVIGAVNTVIAGLLTFLEGSGREHKLRFQANEWEKLREHIEQRERDVASPVFRGDVQELVQAIESMYEDTKHEIDAVNSNGTGGVSAGQQRRSSQRTSLAPPA